MTDVQKILNIKSSEIKTIICPRCRKFLMNKHTENGGYWKCPVCIYSYQLGWFDEFHQFDHLINVPLMIIREKDEDEEDDIFMVKEDIYKKIYNKKKKEEKDGKFK